MAKRPGLKAMFKTFKKIMLFIQKKQAVQNCTCQQTTHPPCNECIESWMIENHKDLKNRYKKLPEPLRQQTIDRQMRLYREFIDDESC